MVAAISGVNEATVTLGTVFDPVLDPDEDVPPHAARINPDSAKTGTSLPNFIRTSLVHSPLAIPAAFFPRTFRPRGESAPATGLLSKPIGTLSGRSA
jgi:hypothetical protein